MMGRNYFSVGAACVTLVLISSASCFNVKDEILPLDFQTFGLLESFHHKPSLLELPAFSHIRASLDSKNSFVGLNVPKKVDCYGMGFLEDLMTSVFDWTPASSGSVNVKYYLSTRSNRRQTRIPYARSSINLSGMRYDPTKKTVFIVHGFINHGGSAWILELTKALLDREDLNVIAVDWSGGSMTVKYWKAVANTRRVGSDMGIFIQRLLKLTGGSVDNLHLVGHSLGAHICAFSSTYVSEKVGRITGLDPASPCYQTDDKLLRLDEGDAKFVDVIHTNGRQDRLIGFGLQRSVGNIDFYPNGGKTQPGCGENDFLANLMPLEKKLKRAICSHGRAYAYFTESVRKNGCDFIGHKWHKMTYDEAVKALAEPCSEGTCSKMGYDSDENAVASGNFYVQTGTEKPFCGQNVQLYPPDRDMIDLFTDNNLLPRKGAQNSREQY